MDAINVTHLITVYGILAVSAIATVITTWARFGSVMREVGATREQIAVLQREVQDVKNEIVRVNVRIDQLDGKLDSKVDDLREEMRRNTERILQALVHHSHQDGSPPASLFHPKLSRCPPMTNAQNQFFS